MGRPLKYFNLAERNAALRRRQMNYYHRNKEKINRKNINRYHGITPSNIIDNKLKIIFRKEYTKNIKINLTLIRNCPDCKQNLTYSDLRMFLNHQARNTKCDSCKRIQCQTCQCEMMKKSKSELCIACYKQKHFSQLSSDKWIRNCPCCHSLVKYKTKVGYNIALKTNPKCSKCWGKIRKKEFKKCKSCKTTTLSKKNKSGLCNICYPIIGRPKQERNRLCLDCNTLIEFKCSKSYRKSASPHWKCSNCHKFKEIEKRCVLCGSHFKITDKSLVHLKTCGCYKISRETMLDRFYQEHGHRYGYLDMKYVNTNTKINVTCYSHGNFLITPRNHSIGRGCPKCARSFSKGEYAIDLYFKNNNIEYIHQAKFEKCINPLTNMPLKYDFYIPSRNLLVEFDGHQHSRVGAKVGKHILTPTELVAIQYRDQLKNEYAKNNNIKLLRISYKDINKIEDILKQHLRTI